MKRIILVFTFLILSIWNINALENKQFVIYWDSLSTWFCLWGKETPENKIWFNYLNSKNKPLIFSEIWKTAKGLYGEEIKDKNGKIIGYWKIPYETIKYWFNKNNELNYYSMFIKQNNSFTLNKDVLKKVPILNDFYSKKITPTNIILLWWNDLINNTTNYTKIKKRADLWEVNLTEALNCKTLNCINKLKINSNWTETVWLLSYKTKTLKDFIIDYNNNKNYQSSLSNKTGLSLFLDSLIKSNNNSITYIVILPYYLIENENNKISKKEYLVFKSNLNNLIKNKKNSNLKVIDISEAVINKYLNKQKFNTLYCEDKMHFNEKGHKILWNIINSYIK